MTTRTVGLAAAALFIGCIVAANWVTTQYGMVSVGFGLTATAGTYFAGLSFVLRDTVQDTLGRWETVRLICEGALVSLLLAATVFEADSSFLPPGVTPMSIAAASGIAFLLSETSDLGVYTPLRRRGYLRAALASNVVGAVVDTFLFLWVAGFPIAGAWQGQLVGKLLVTAVVVAGVLALRPGRKARAA